MDILSVKGATCATNKSGSVLLKQGLRLYNCFLFFLSLFGDHLVVAVQGRCKRWPSCLNSGFVGFILGSCVVFAG